MKDIQSLRRKETLNKSANNSETRRFFMEFTIKACHLFVWDDPGRANPGDYFKNPGEINFFPYNNNSTRNECKKSKLRLVEYKKAILLCIYSYC